MTPSGLDKMKKRYLNEDYSHCSRVLCQGQPVLPTCMCEYLRFSRVKVYCPKYGEVYTPEKGQVEVDGAYFGKSFPAVFFDAFPSLIPKEKPIIYVPKVFGFKIYKNIGSKYEKIKKYKYKDTYIGN